MLITISSEPALRILQVSPDGNPLIGAIPGVKGAYIAAGCAQLISQYPLVMIAGASLQNFHSHL